MTFTGSCNRDLFELWLEECLLPQLQPGNAIVIDSASFHHSQRIEDRVAAAECEIIPSCLLKSNSQMWKEGH